MKYAGGGHCDANAFEREPGPPMFRRGCGIVIAAMLVAGCHDGGRRPAAAEAHSDAAPSGKALQASAGSFLAYETELEVQVPVAAIDARLDALQQACLQARFGDCTVLSVAQQGGPQARGDIELRIAPVGVEPLLRLAGEDGEIISRNTRAEDLAVQVADTRMAQDRLQKEHARLLQFQQRSELKVADLLAISQRLAEIEAAAETAQREASLQNRRIDTQKISVTYRATGGEQGRSEVGRAFAESGRIFASSVAVLVRVGAGLAPVAIVLVVALVPLRGWWRRRRARSG